MQFSTFLRQWKPSIREHLYFLATNSTDLCTPISSSVSLLQQNKGTSCQHRPIPPYMHWTPFFLLSQALCLFCISLCLLIIRLSYLPSPFLMSYFFSPSLHFVSFTFSPKTLQIMYKHLLGLMENIANYYIGIIVI